MTPTTVEGREKKARRAARDHALLVKKDQRRDFESPYRVIDRRGAAVLRRANLDELEIWLSRWRPATSTVARGRDARMGDLSAGRSPRERKQWKPDDPRWRDMPGPHPNIVPNP